MKFKFFRAPEPGEKPFPGHDHNPCRNGQGPAKFCKSKGPMPRYFR